MSPQPRSKRSEMRPNWNSHFWLCPSGWLIRVCPVLTSGTKVGAHGAFGCVLHGSHLGGNDDRKQDDTYAAKLLNHIFPGDTMTLYYSCTLYV